MMQWSENRQFPDCNFSCLDKVSESVLLHLTIVSEEWSGSSLQEHIVVSVHNQSLIQEAGGATRLLIQPR